MALLAVAALILAACGRSATRASPSNPWIQCRVCRDAAQFIERSEGVDPERRR